MRITLYALILANKSLHAIALGSNFSRKNLQSNFTIELRILREINLAHPALTQLRANFVLT